MELESPRKLEFLTIVIDQTGSEIFGASHAYISDDHTTRVQFTAPGQGIYNCTIMARNPETDPGWHSIYSFHLRTPHECILKGLLKDPNGETVFGQYTYKNEGINHYITFTPPDEGWYLGRMYEFNDDTGFTRIGEFVMQGNPAASYQSSSFLSIPSLQRTAVEYVTAQSRSLSRETNLSAMSNPEIYGPELDPNLLDWTYSTVKDRFLVFYSWFDYSNPAEQHTITRQDYLAGVPYGSQEIHSTHSLDPWHRVETVRQHGISSQKMILEEELQFQGDKPYISGFGVETTQYSDLIWTYSGPDIPLSRTPRAGLECFTQATERYDYNSPIIQGIVRAHIIKNESAGYLETIRAVWDYVYHNVSYSQVGRPNAASHISAFGKGSAANSPSSPSPFLEPAAFPRG